MQPYVFRTLVKSEQEANNVIDFLETKDLYGDYVKLPNENQYRLIFLSRSLDQVKKAISGSNFIKLDYFDPSEPNNEFIKYNYK